MTDFFLKKSTAISSHTHLVEPPAAVLAPEGRLPRVDPQVAQQELALGEGAAAGGAREAQARPRARARVGVLPAQVAPQGAPAAPARGEGLGAMRAGLRKRAKNCKIALEKLCFDLTCCSWTSIGSFVS